MARTTITKTTVVGPYPTLQPAADSLDVAFTAADTGNKNQFAPTGDDVLLAWNSGASPYTITITSVADERNRTGDITTYSLAAGDICAFRIKVQGWRQSDGMVYFEGSNTAVKFAVLSL